MRFDINDPRTQKIFAGAVLAIAGMIVLVQAKILFLALLFSAGAYFLCKQGSAAQRAAVAVLPLAVGLLLAWLAASLTQGAVSAASTMKASMKAYTLPGLEGQQAKMSRETPQAAHRPLSYRSWIGARPPACPADAVGRWALLIGAGVGLLAAFKLRPTARHGPGVVQGKPVVEGGWADVNDLAPVCDFGPPRLGDGGIPLGKLKNQIVRLNPNKGKIKIAGHSLIVGATGTGKSYTCIRNLIIAAACDNHSIVVTDLKGELFADMAVWLEKQGYDLYGFNVTNPSRSHRWNPLLECRDFEEIMDVADWLITAAGDDHAFFSGGEKNILAAVMAYTRWALPERQRHMRAALSILSWPQEVIDQEYARAYREKKVSQAAFETWRAAQGHYSNYVEGVRNKVRSITKGPLAALTAANDFRLEDLGRKKTALFLILPDEGDLRSLYVPFYAFMFRRLKEAAEISSGGRLPVPVRFIMDEFANIGKVPEIDKVCALGRSRGIMVQVAIQNIGQLQGLYRKENAWKAVVGNMPVKICLSTDDLDTARFFTGMMGEARVLDTKESRDVSTPWDALEIKRRQSTKDTQIMSSWELLQLPEDDCVVLLRGRKPAYMQKIAWVELPQAKEILACPKLRPGEYLPETEEAEVPPYPEAEPVYKEPERKRGTTAKKQDVDVSPEEIEEYL